MWSAEKDLSLLLNCNLKLTTLNFTLEFLSELELNWNCFHRFISFLPLFISSLLCEEGKLVENISSLFFFFFSFEWFSRTGLRQLKISRHYSVFVFVFVYVVFTRYIPTISLWKVTRNYWQARYDFPDWTVAKFLVTIFFSFFFRMIFANRIKTVENFSSPFCFFFFYTLLTYYLARDSCKKWQEIIGKASLISLSSTYVNTRSQWNKKKHPKDENLPCFSVCKSATWQRKCNNQIILYANIQCRNGVSEVLSTKTNHWSVIKKKTFVAVLCLS